MGRAWKKLHQKNSDLIRQTFRKLRLFLTVDESEDDELNIKNIPNVKMKN